MKKEIVSDTGPLISLEKLDAGFNMMRDLYKEIIVPPKVMEEISGGRERDYIKLYDIKDIIKVQDVEHTADLHGIGTLHDGEAQAISLAYNLGIPLLIEELKGRKIASIAKIKFSGVAGQIVIAFKEGVIPIDKAYKNLEIMLNKNRINKVVYDALCLQIDKGGLIGKSVGRN